VSELSRISAATPNEICNEIPPRVYRSVSVPD
jgi:hypothetical protein